MIQMAKELNLQFQKKEEMNIRLSNKFISRRRYMSEIKEKTFNLYSSQMFVDPISLYLYLTLTYWKRVKNRSVKTVNIELSSSTFLDIESPLLDQMFDKVIKHFAKHQIKITVKTRVFNGEIKGWKISLKTLELY